jgi:hypothetical protein
LNQVLDLPYSFVLIGVNHSGNYTGGLRKIDKNVLRSKGSNDEANFYDTWDEDTQMFIDSLSSFLKKKANQSSVEDEELEEEQVQVAQM